MGLFGTIVFNMPQISWNSILTTSIKWIYLPYAFSLHRMETSIQTVRHLNLRFSTHTLDANLQFILIFQHSIQSIKLSFNCDWDENSKLLDRVTVFLSSLTCIPLNNLTLKFNHDNVLIRPSRLKKN